MLVLVKAGDSKVTATTLLAIIPAMEKMMVFCILAEGSVKVGGSGILSVSFNTLSF